MWSFFSKKKKSLSCPLCASQSDPFGSVDFNKHCDEAKSGPLPSSGVMVEYYLCSECGFCWAPELHSWSIEEFESKIYNKDYIRVDPEYVESRPRTNAQMLIANIHNASSIRHLDYGGGNGMLSRLLSEAGWDSISYDPMIDHNTEIETLGKFDLVTTFEVFEHVPDVHRLINDLDQLTSTNGIILFSTIVSDQFITPEKKLDWWYASPRNGHISLYTYDSLKRLGRIRGFRFASFSPALHAYFKSIPPWANNLIKVE